MQCKKVTENKTMKRNKRTFDDYKRIGEKFKAVESALLDLEIDVSNTFTKAIYHKMRTADKHTFEGQI